MGDQLTHFRCRCSDILRIAGLVRDDGKRCPGLYTFASKAEAKDATRGWSFTNIKKACCCDTPGLGEAFNTLPNPAEVRWNGNKTMPGLSVHKDCYAKLQKRVESPNGSVYLICTKEKREGKVHLNVTKRPTGWEKDANGSLTDVPLGYDHALLAMQQEEAGVQQEDYRQNVKEAASRQVAALADLMRNLSPASQLEAVQELLTGVPTPVRRAINFDPAAAGGSAADAATAAAAAAGGCGSATLPSGKSPLPPAAKTPAGPPRPTPATQHRPQRQRRPNLAAARAAGAAAAGDGDGDGHGDRARDHGGAAEEEEEEEEEEGEEPSGAVPDGDEDLQLGDECRESYNSFVAKLDAVGPEEKELIDNSQGLGEEGAAAAAAAAAGGSQVEPSQAAPSQVDPSQVEPSQLPYDMTQPVGGTQACRISMGMGERRVGGGEGAGGGFYGSIGVTYLKRVFALLFLIHSGVWQKAALFDAGVGLGRPLLVALMCRYCNLAYGVDIDINKVQKAYAFIDHFFDNARTAKFMEGVREPIIFQKSLEDMLDAGWLEQPLALVTHVFSFWTGMPDSAKAALGRMFSQSMDCVGVAIVQANISTKHNKNAPVELMESYGFGTLDLVGKVPVKMVGSNESKQAYIFKKKSAVMGMDRDARAKLARNMGPDWMEDWEAQTKALLAKGTSGQRRQAREGRSGDTPNAKQPRE